MRSLFIVLLCLIATKGPSQSEYLPITFSAVNLSTSLRSADDLNEKSIIVGYTNKKNVALNINASFATIDGTSSYTDITEMHIGPRFDLFLGKNGIISKFGIEYNFGWSSGAPSVQERIETERKNNLQLDLSFSLPIGSKNGVAFYPTLYGGLSNRDYSFKGSSHFAEMRPNIFGDFHEEISMSLPMIINFSGAQLAIVPKMGRSVYNTFFELGVAANLYHSARCTIVRRKNKRNKVLSKFYN